MRALLTIILFLGTFHLIAQTNDQNITFEYDHSMRVHLDKVWIQIKKNDQMVTLSIKTSPMAGYDEKTDLAKGIDTSFQISVEAYEKIEEKLSSLDLKVLKAKHLEGGLDGYTCSLHYRLRGQVYSWKVFMPKHQKELHPFHEICEDIVKLAGEDPSYIFD